MSNYKKNIIIIFISTLISLYFIEIYLNLFNEKKNFNNIKKVYKKKTGKNFDERTPREIYKDSKDEGFVISVPPVVHFGKDNSIFPLSGISNSKTILCNENGYYSTYKSDRFGFNNLNSEWDQKDIEFLLIGDSFVQGACVNKPNDIASILKKLSGRSVLNLGFGGSGPLIEYATLREYFIPGTKNVIWFYYEGNDLLDLENEVKNIILKKYIENKNFIQNLKIKQNEIDLINSQEISNSFLGDKLYNIKKNSEIKYKIIKFLRLDKTKNIVKSTFSQEPGYYSYDLENFKKILNETKEFLLKNNSNFYFVYLPDLERYVYCRYKPCNKGFLSKKKLKNHRYKKEIVKEIIDDLGIYFIDIDKEVFVKEKDKLQLFPFGILDHYNPEGYYKVALRVYNIINEVD